MRNIYTPLLGCAVVSALGLGASASGQVIIGDDFEVDTSASYTRFDDSNAPSGDGTTDTTAEFAYDYVSAGIPLAPNSAAGDTGGLLLTANDFAGELDHITLFHDTVVEADAYTLQVDMYMRVDDAAGTTEFATVGVAGDASDFNSIFSPIAGSGHFISITGEGGSSSDYRHFVEGIGPINTGDESYLNDANTTQATGDTYQNLFPDSQFPGSPGNLWTTLTIDVTPELITYSLDGTPIIQDEVVATEGQVSLAYNDLFAASAGPHAVIYDNLTVVVPEPTAGLAAMGLLGLALRRRRAC